MNKDVAYVLIDAELRRLLELPYAELINLIETPETKLVVGEDGKSYQLEIAAIWDIARGEDVRVIVSVDDGGWRAFKPLTQDFVMRPDGSFVDEFTGDS
jgi:hypothetical protein